MLSPMKLRGIGLVMAAVSAVAVYVTLRETPVPHALLTLVGGGGPGLDARGGVEVIFRVHPGEAPGAAAARLPGHLPRRQVGGEPRHRSALRSGQTLRAESSCGHLASTPSP